MIGSSASTLSGLVNCFDPRSAYSAIKVPMNVVPAAVISARNSVFQATPQRTPPTRQPSPHTRSCARRSASAPSEKLPSSARNAPIRLLPTGSATKSNSSALQNTTAPATKRSPRK